MTIVGELNRIANAAEVLAGKPGGLGPPPGDGPSVTLDLANTTQGPPWPPSEIVDKNNDFVLIGGMILTDKGPQPNQGGVIVSKDTVPPLVKGVPNFNDPFGSAYKVKRELDLSPGSKDLEMELYASSCGPFEAVGPGRPRIPRKGQNKYNLNPVTALIQGVSADDYNLDQRPLNEVTVWHLSTVPEDVPVGIPVDPASPAPCGLRDYNFRNNRPPIRLGDYLRARGQMRITLTGYDKKAKGYTSGRFDFSLADLLPRAVHSVWAMRQINFELPPNPDWRPPDPLAIPPLFVTDSEGRARVSFEVPNPLPGQSSKEASNRIIGLVISFQSSYNNWGAALGLYAPGVCVHGVLTPDFSNVDLVTVAPSS